MAGLTDNDNREARDESAEQFTAHMMELMVVGGALSSATPIDRGGWRIQHEIGDETIAVPANCAMMLAYGFRLGVMQDE